VKFTRSSLKLTMPKLRKGELLAKMSDFHSKSLGKMKIVRILDIILYFSQKKVFKTYKVNRSPGFVFKATVTYKFSEVDFAVLLKQYFWFTKYFQEKSLI